MRKILAVFMLFAGLNLAAGEKMQNLKIILKSSNGEATAILDDTAAARSFAAQLPITLNLEDYGGHEKVAKLPKPLDTRGAPSGSDGKKVRSHTLLRGITLSSTTATSLTTKASCAWA